MLNRPHTAPYRYPEIGPTVRGSRFACRGSNLRCGRTAVLIGVQTERPSQLLQSTACRNAVADRDQSMRCEAVHPHGRARVDERVILLRREAYGCPGLVLLVKTNTHQNCRAGSGQNGWRAWNAALNLTHAAALGGTGLTLARSRAPGLFRESDRVPGRIVLPLSPQPVQRIRICL